MSGSRSELGGYRFDALLARSGASLLFRAHGKEAGEEVLVEVPREGLRDAPGFAEELRRVAVEAAELQHPRIAQTSITGVEDGVPYTVCPDPNGAELTPLVEGLGGLSLARAGSIVSQVAGGLAAAHRAGLVHGTLEPARVLITHGDGGDTVTLTGFGFAPPPGSDGSSTRPFGLPVADFAAPEQIRGEPASAAGDIYALGCVLYHALVGEPPAQGADEAATLDFQLHATPRPVTERVPELPAEIENVLARALAKDPAERYPSADDLASDLDALVGPRGPSEKDRKANTTQRWKESIEGGAHQWSPSKPVITWPQAGSPEVTAVPPTEPVEPAGEATSAGPVDWPQPPHDDDEKNDGHPPVRRPRSGGRTAARILGGLVALAAVGGLIALLVAGGDDDSKSSKADAPASPPPADQRPERPARKSPAGGLATWPKRDAYTVIIFVSNSDRAGAEARARRAARLNVKAGVISSGDYPNLPPGLQVGFAGVYDSRQQAEKAADRLRAEGIARAPYVRRIQGSGG